MNNREFRAEVARDLTTNILPYWTEKMTDPRGGFYGRRDGNDFLHPDAPKGAILNARILWTFASAYRLTADEAWLAMARRAYDYIHEHFIDREYGGVYWELDAEGNPTDTRKQFYAIAFTIYGLAEYYRATRHEEALQLARALFADIESHSLDPVRGGYIEAATREWNPIADMRLSEKDANTAKTMNTHLHILEAYTALLRVDPNNNALRQATARLLEIFLTTIVDNRTHHLLLFFDNDWTPTDNTISYGHDIEASWLMLEAAHVLNDEHLTARTHRCTHHIAEAALQGRCTDGSMIYERHHNGHYDNERHWWVQAEAVVGQAYLACFHNMPQQMERAKQTWEYIRTNLIDHDGGEWYWSRMPDGSVNRSDDKAGFWKCPYHNGRMAMEIMQLIGE